MSYIVMKYDDLTVENTEAFARVADFSLRTGCPVSMGVIGKSLVEGDVYYKRQVRKWMNGGIEIWNHGYFHTMEEFSSSPYDRQCHSIACTQRLMETELGRRAVTFGSPHNNSTETTIRALKAAAPEIGNYLFAVDGMSVTDARQLLIRCDMEITTGHVDIDFLKHNYSALREFPYMVIQGHPGLWRKEDFERNEMAMSWLREEGNAFVTPCGLPSCSLGGMVGRKGKAYAEALVTFAAGHKKVALYGAGEIGREWFWFLRSKSVSPDIFVVSDGQAIYESEICALPVVPISRLLDYREDYGVIVAMMPRFHREIREKLLLEKVDCFCPEKMEHYMELVHYIRAQNGSL